MRLILWALARSLPVSPFSVPCHTPSPCWETCLSCAAVLSVARCPLSSAPWSLGLPGTSWIPDSSHPAPAPWSSALPRPTRNDAWLGCFLSFAQPALSPVSRRCLSPRGSSSGSDLGCRPAGLSRPPGATDPQTLITCSRLVFRALKDLDGGRAQPSDSAGVGDRSYQPTAALQWRRVPGSAASPAGVRTSSGTQASLVCATAGSPDGERLFHGHQGSPAWPCGHWGGRIPCLGREGCWSRWSHSRQTPTKRSPEAVRRVGAGQCDVGTTAVALGHGTPQRSLL